MESRVRYLVNASALAMLAGVSACSGGDAGDRVGSTSATLSDGTYLGCFVDRSDRALTASLGSVTTTQDCITRARGAGYAYAGLQWFGQCWAGNALGYDRAPDSDCNTPCPTGEMCGGAWRNSIYQLGAPPPASPSCGAPTLRPGETLLLGQSRSLGSSTLIYQNDGNLVHYQYGRARWATMTFATPGRTVMQTDGNLAVFSASGVPVWWSGTPGHRGASFYLNEVDWYHSRVAGADCRELWSEPVWW
jgi:hypothetical protein